MASHGSGAPRIVAVGSGKGGAGKTLAVANVGIFLATVGKRVVILDAAFGSATLHTFVGIPRPKRTLVDLLGRDGVSLPDLVTPTPVPGLGLITGEGDPERTVPEPEEVEHLARELRKLPVDYVLVDLATGTGGPVLDLFLRAEVGALLVSPDPASVELGYRFLRSAFARRLEKTGLAGEFDFARLRHFAGGVAAPRDIHDEAWARDRELAARVEAEMLAFRPRVVVNNARSKADLDVGPAIATAAYRRLGLPITYLGHLEYDDAAWVSLRRRRPLLVEHPESRAAKCIEKLTRRILARETEKHFVSIAVGDSHYDLFDIEPSASEEDIRRANRRTRSIYGKESVVVGGLYSPDQLAEFHARLDDAYDTLMDPVKRKAYDQALFPDGVPVAAAQETQESKGVPAVQNRAPPPEDRPPMPEIGADTEFTGPLMRQIREAKGIDLREISERTKIGMTYLAALETENFDKLPATVYVRGFLDQYTRILGLDRDRVLETYLRRYRMARESRETAIEP